MEHSTYHIYTLHRERFILCVLLGVFFAAFLASQFNTSEVYKIITILFCLPVLLFLSITLSKNPSVWQIDNTQLTIVVAGRKIIYQRDDIAKIQISTRSGGTLITLHFNNKNHPKRYWSNKLFQKQDDTKELIEAFEQHDIPVLMQ